MSTAGAIWLIAVTVVTVLSQLALKKASTMMAADFAKPVEFLLSAITNAYFWAFGISAVLNAFAWVVLLKHVNLSLSVPLSSGLGFLLLGILAYFIFGEKLSFTQMLGFAVILVGIAIALAGTY